MQKTQGKIRRSVVELVEYRQLVYNLVATNLKVRYRRSFLGLLWTLLNPLLLMLVMWVVFSRFGRIQEKNYAMFLLSGLMVWIFFQQSISQSLNSIVKNKSLIDKIYVPKLVFPISVVISNLVNVGFFLVAYVILVIPTQVGIQTTIPFVLPALLMVYILASGSALLMATLNVFFRDMEHLTSVILRALFYLSPILYRPEMLGPKANTVLRLNPVYYPILTARGALYDGVVASWDLWVIGYAVALSTLVIGWMVFVSVQQRFVYYA
jgi:ABC-type polysaccharide/polyol phosphate export permease